MRNHSNQITIRTIPQAFKMRLSILTNLLIASSTLAAVQEQKPLGFGVTAQSWFDKAKDFATGVFAPVNPGATGPSSVVPITSANWQSTFAPSVTSNDQSWMVLISGGNKSCYGRCGMVEEAWSEAAVAAKLDSKAPKLGYVNCDYERVLCAVWNAAVPSIWYINVPSAAPGQNKPATDIYTIKLNSTDTSSSDITAIYKDKKYKNEPAMNSILHPFDGFIAQSGLQMPLAYVLTVFAIIPSWVVMVGISMMARTFT